MTNLCAVQCSVWPSIVSVDAFVAVDAFRIVTTVSTDTTATIVVVNVKRFVLTVDSFIIAALFRMTVTIAGLTLKMIIYGGRSPFFLRIAGTALVTLGTARIVLALTVERER